MTNQPPKLQVRLSPETLAALSEHAEHERRPISAMARIFIEDGLKAALAVRAAEGTAPKAAPETQAAPKVQAAPEKKAARRGKL